MTRAYPHLHRMRDRQGRLRYLLRMPGRKGVTIKGDLGSEEFARNYHLALTGFEPVEPKGLGIPRQGTVAALVRTYLASAAFTNLASETSRHRRNLVEEFAEGDAARFQSRCGLLAGGSSLGGQHFHAHTPISQRGYAVLIFADGKDHDIVIRRVHDLAIHGHAQS